MRKQQILHLIFLLAPFFAAAQDHLIEFKDSIDFMLLGREVGVWEDDHLDGQELDLDSILKLPDAIYKYQNAFHYGFSNSSYWFKFQLANTQDVEQQLILELDNPYLDSIFFYKTSLGEVIDEKFTGVSFPFEERDVKHRNFLIKIDLAAKDSVTCYLNVKKSKYPLNFNFYLWKAHYRLYNQQFIEDTILWLFFSLCFIYITLISIFIGIVRLNYYLYYIVYLILGTLFVFTDLGLSNFLIWTDSSYLQRMGILIITNLYLIFGIFFFEEHFKTKTYFPRIDVILKAITYLAIFFIPVAFFVPHLSVSFGHFVFLFHYFLYVGTSILFFYLFFISLSRKQRFFSGWFLFGFSMHGFSIVATILQTLGLFKDFSLSRSIMEWIHPLTFHTQFTMMIGIILEMIVVLIIGIFHLRYLYDEKRKIEKELSNEKKKGTRMLILGIEKDRERTAQDLHDGLGAYLSALKIRMDVLINQIKNQPVEESVKDIQVQKDILATSIKMLRNISMDLMPETLYKKGLIAATKDLIYFFQTRNSKLKFNLFCNDNFEDVSDYAKLILWRVVQELLNNVNKHSRASIANLHMIRHDNIMLVTMEDNGRGFMVKKTKEGNGLNNINKRVSDLNGKVHVDSAIGSGTTTTIEIPLDSILNN